MQNSGLGENGVFTGVNFLLVEKLGDKQRLATIPKQANIKPDATLTCFNLEVAGEKRRRVVFSSPHIVPNWADPVVVVPLLKEYFESRGETVDFVDEQRKPLRLIT